TPWTIPSNLAVAIHPDYDYILAETDDSCYLLAKDLAEKAFGEIGISGFRETAVFKGSDLCGIEFKHPIYDRKSPVLLADYVTLEDGTGVVHTAPGHGKEDFETGKRYGLEVLNPVNGKGCYTAEAPGFEGMHVFRHGNAAVLEKLTEAGALLKSQTITHSYPHCWRCHKPVIFRTTPQWFMSLDHKELRQKILEAIKKVEFFPKEAENRLTAMMTNAPDWCLSRQRSWGVGIPVMYCSDCNEAVLDKRVIDKVYEDALANSSDSWFEKDPEFFLPAGYKCPKCGGSHFIKEKDVLDVWFDSGSSCRAVLDNFDHISFPADMYLEGSDQHRGWFNKSIVVGVATRGESPFRQLVSHGFVLDKDGKAMSKSLGNTIPPKDIINNMGADVLRIYIATCDYADDIRIGQEMLKNAADGYRRIRNTFRFMLGNLSDFDPSADAVSYDKLYDIDKYAIARTQQLISDVTEAYNGYEFHKAVKAIINFCSVDMSSLYLDVLKDRLYTSGKDWPVRRSAQTGLYNVLKTLVRLTAPVIPHTSEEIWQFMQDPDKEESVFLAGFPSVNVDMIYPDNRWNEILAVREKVFAALEDAKTNGIIAKPIEAKVTLHLPKDLIDLLPKEPAELASYFIVSQVELKEGEGEIGIEKAAGEKCERCWLVMKDVGTDPEHPGLCSRCADALK
ncbi:MAG: isoleucine--tRNA ligase, partial [Abditibacteriota bacterium]|nr:isoleucine--tRNA ligase [Abditibacteriota bacterium]